MCDREVKGRGMCAFHYRAWYKYGDPLHPVPRRTSKGVPREAEIGARISASRTGLRYKFSRRVSRPGQMKENHWNWKGGIASAEKLLRQRFAQEIAPQVLARDEYTCAVCYQVGGKLHVDHIERWADAPELRFEPSNCRTLCVPCHYYVTFKRTMPSTSTWGMDRRDWNKE